MLSEWKVIALTTFVSFFMTLALGFLYISRVGL